MSEFPLRDRTRALALRVIKVVNPLPQDEVGRVIGHQLLKSGTSVGANYRASMRAKSPADMVNKLKIVEEEADETIYWLELLVDAELIPQSKLQPLIAEANEIVAMTVASIKTIRSKRDS